MKKVTVLLALLLLASFSWLQAQTMQITGTVTSSEDGSPLPGVSVAVKGTTLGGITDINGKFTIGNVPTDAKILEIRFVGYQSREIEIAGRSTIDVVLEPANIALEEVVVTALGISRDKKALGYAVQDVKGDELAKAKETNIVNSLTGKVAGVQITNASGAVGSSSRVVIRGNSSFGNNQPLWIVDGVPISNSATAVSQWGDTDFGNAAMDIDPTNIESVSVLKGANAAALYGSRAANGVIVVTTKKAKEGKKGIGVAITSSVTFDNTYMIPNYQNEYGQGLNGSEYNWLMRGWQNNGMSYQDYATTYGFTYYDGNGGGVWDHVDESWGPRLDIGLLIPQFTSPLDESTADPYDRIGTAWISYPNNVKDFFETGITFDNNVTITQASENVTARLSVSNQTTSGTIPNTDLTKNSLNFNGTMNLGKRIKANASVNYVKNHSDNLPGQGYGPNNVMQSLGGWFGRQVDMAPLKENWQTYNIWGNPYNWNTSYHNNPYWTTGYNTTMRDRDRLYGNFNLSADLTDWMTLMGRIGTDLYTEMRKHVEYNDSRDYMYGHFWQNQRYQNETNMDLILTMNKEFGDISVNGTIGANSRRSDYHFMSLSASELTVPNLFTIGNVKGNPTTGMYDEAFETNSVYAQASIGWKRTLFLDVTARNDWSSTLPADSWSFFYPSVTGSFILTELLELDPAILSFAKLRGGWAQVGNDTGPYQLSSVYVSNDPWDGVTMFNTTRTMPPIGLKPEITTSIEAGLEMKFLNNRVGFDLTLYDAKTTNQIMNIDISNSTGYNAMLINAGEIENKGIELQLNGDVVKTESGFTWNMNVNWAKNLNTVNALYKDEVTGQTVDAYTIGSSWNGVTIEARVGEPFGVIKGNGFVRDESGNVVVGSNGLPMIEDAPIEIGNITPDWTGGISNTFAYKGISLSFLIDGRKGGDIFSVSDWFGAYAGLTEETARDGIREHGLVVNGVKENGDVNDIVVSADSYFGGYWGREEFSIIDGSYIKLREIVFSYALPKSLMSKISFIESANFSVVGRNLALLYTHPSNDVGIDPETGFGTSNNGLGLEQFQLPTARSIGFKLSLNF